MEFEMKATRIGPIGHACCPKCGNYLQNGKVAFSINLMRCATCKTVFENLDEVKKPSRSPFSMLFVIEFKHYAPRSEESGIREIVECESEQRLLGYIDKKYYNGNLFNPDVTEDSSISYYNLNASGFNTPSEDDIFEAGLEIELDPFGNYDDNAIVGPKHSIILLVGGDTWDVPNDTTYGHTCYKWRRIDSLDELVKKVT